MIRPRSRLRRLARLPRQWLGFYRICRRHNGVVMSAHAATTWAWAGVWA